MEVAFGLGPEAELLLGVVCGCCRRRCSRESLLLGHGRRVAQHIMAVLLLKHQVVDLLFAHFMVDRLKPDTPMQRFSPSSLRCGQRNLRRRDANPLTAKHQVVLAVATHRHCCGVVEPIVGLEDASAVRN